jgi:hypothetical protein
MPLSNDRDKMWAGWLADGLGGQEKQAAEALISALKARFSATPVQSAQTAER